MSDLAKSARKANHEKAERLVKGDPHGKVDASGYRQPPPILMGEQSGAKPHPAKFKRGGKVEGEHAKHHAGKKPRAKKADGGSFVPTERFGFSPTSGSSIMRNAGMKRGGEAHSDEKQDIALIEKEVKPRALKEDRPKRKHGGRADAHWIEHAGMKKGALHSELHVPEGEKIPEKKLEKAEHSSNKLVAKRAHLAETLRSLPHECDGGRVARKSGGRASKGKMNVNIVIATGKDPQPQGAAPPMPMPPPRPMPSPAPAPAPAAAMGAMPPSMPPQMPPGGPMPRKRGGRTMHAGAGSGEGRLEKIGLQR